MDRFHAFIELLVGIAVYVVFLPILFRVDWWLGVAFLAIGGVWLLSHIIFFITIPYKHPQHEEPKHVMSPRHGLERNWEELRKNREEDAGSGGAHQRHA